MNTDPILRVDSVHVSYAPGIEILRGLSLATQAKALTLVVGPNGAGKSTLLRAIFGFLAPYAGRIFLRGKATAGLKPSDMKAPE
jgi:ABC-type branched-subunit amino acid transport system ATPase component